MFPDPDVFYSPDGLSEQVIDLLIDEVAAELVDVPALTSALVDGSAAERRRRRSERRALSHVVRALPLAGSSTTSEAA